MSCFSDEETINEDGEDGDEEGWEQVDNVVEAKMARLAKGQTLESRTTGYLLGFPATSVPSTVLRALRDLMCGRKNSPSTRPTCYVSRHTHVYDKGE